MGSLTAFGFYFLLAFMCGVVLVNQPGVNGTLSNKVGGALNAATVSMCVSAALIYDKFGLFGYGQSPITSLRLIGVGLIVVGTGLVLVRQ